MFLQVGYGLLLGLFPAEDLARDMHGDAAVPAADGTPNRMSLAHIVGSEAAVDDAVAHAIGAGGTVVKPPQHAAFGGYHAYVADPDGFAWEIAYNPGHSVAPDGRVSIGPIEP